MEETFRSIATVDESNETRDEGRDDSFAPASRRVYISRHLRHNNHSHPHTAPVANPERRKNTITVPHDSASLFSTAFGAANL